LERLVEIDPRRLQSRREPEEDTREEGETEREGEHFAVDSDVRQEALDRRSACLSEGRQSQKRLQGRPAKKEPENTAGQGEEHALGDELGEDARRAGAKRGADRH